MKNFQIEIISKLKFKTFIFFSYILLSSFSNVEAMENPFYKNYDTPFEIPPFSEIEETHFVPAFLKGMKEHNNDISDIISNSEKPSFENVIIAMERSGSLLDKVSSVFYNLSGSTTNPKIQEIEKEIDSHL